MIKFDTPAIWTAQSGRAFAVSEIFEDGDTKEMYLVEPSGHRRGPFDHPENDTSLRALHDKEAARQEEATYYTRQAMF